jgi:hypothetical protein
MARDELRERLHARGLVEVECWKCGWFYWLHSEDPRLTTGAPLECSICKGATDKGG